MKRTSTAPTPIVATINPQIAAFTIALRADMDALPSRSATKISLPLANPGRHARLWARRPHGMLLGAAKALHAVRDRCAAG